MPEEYRKYDTKHETTELGYPSVDRPEDQKNEKYHIDWAKAIFSKSFHGKAAIPQSFMNEIDILRAYGKGAQSVAQYLKKDLRLNSATSSTTNTSDGSSLSDRRGGIDHIDTNIISVAPRVKAMTRSYLQNIKEDVIVDSIDATSGAEKEDAKWALFTESKDKEFIDQYKQNAGLDVETMEFQPDTVEELTMYEQAGGFKLSQASNIEKLVKYSLELSGYEGDLENDVYNDLMDVGLACTKKRLDPEDLKFKDEYIDVKYLITQNSKFNDFRNIDWVGHTEFYTIGQLRQLMPSLTEEDFAQMAFAYQSRLSNPADWNKDRGITNDGYYWYDSYMIAVFEAEWKDSEKEEAVFYDNKAGRTSKLPVTDETTKELSGRKRHVKSNLEKRRQCSWIIGTDYGFDWGEVNMQDRPANNKTISNYNIISLSDRPLIAQLVPILDDLHISWLRFQDARARAAKSGYQVNIAKLKAISDGKNKYNIAEVLKMWKENGLLLYQDSISGKYEGGKSGPVERLPDTLLDELQEFTQTWDHALKRMEDLTGINPLILGAAPDPDAPVATQKLSVASSANAIKPLGVAMNAIKRNSAKSFMRRFALACKVRPDIIKSYEGIIGKKAIEKLIESSRSLIDYGMFFHPRPTEAEKAAFLETARMSMNNKKEGREGIDLQTYMFLEEQLYAGANLKMLRFYLGYSEKRIAKEEERKKLEYIRAQGEENAKLEQTKAQGVMAKQGQQGQIDAALEQLRGKNEITQEVVKNNEGAAAAVARRLGLVAQENEPTVNTPQIAPPPPQP
jgi:hypothetical protein